jgi:tetratricopeptide (TPR) repeat protein
MRKDHLKISKKRRNAMKAMLNYIRFYLIIGAAVAMVAPLAWGADMTQERLQAPLFDNLGNYHYQTTTKNDLSQRFFNQGLILAYGFNHLEAARSFREATRIDKEFAMGYWGVALVLGPNINAPMEDKDVPEAFEAIQKALGLSHKASEKERQLIHALAKRYSSKPMPDGSSLDKAYANAMRKVAKAYPKDSSIQALLAESLMDLHPWDYWQKDGKPQPWTTDILDTLKKALKQDPYHPLANHLYIHAVEASKTPERGLAAAQRLEDLVPGAGHLVHMPAHIYIRTGNYHLGTLANQRAVEADAEYITQCRSQGLYPLAYHPHNYHFLWATATLEGNSELAIYAAHKVALKADRKVMREPGYGTLQHYYSIPYYALARFGKWDLLLQEPAPAEDLLYPNGVWHFARGLAFVRKDRIEKAQRELTQLKKIAANPALEKVTIWDINNTADLLNIAVEVLNGEIAEKKGDYETAVDRLKKAVTLEDGLNYDEPPPWYAPVRQTLGAAYQKAGRYTEAENVYQEDLKNFPNNGWSLYGLYLSLDAQGRSGDAQQAKERFNKAWKWADIKLSSSRL